MEKNLQIKTRQPLINYVLPLFGLSMIVSAIFALITQQPSVTAIRSVESTDFSTVWWQTNITLQPQSPSARPFLAITGECVLYVNSHNFLNCLDTQSGQVQWKTRISKLGTNVTSNEESVFVASDVRTYCSNYTPQCDVTKVIAYDILSGEIQWSNSYKRMGVVTQMFADESTLGMIGGGGHGTYGTRIRIDTGTGDLVPYEKSMPSAPSIYDDQTFAFSEGNVVSNVTLTDNIAYFMMDDATLLAKDISDEELIGSANLEPSQVPLGFNNLYQIAAKDEMVVIYMGDSKQLFTLRFTPTK